MTNDFVRRREQDQTEEPAAARGTGAVVAATAGIAATALIAAWATGLRRVPAARASRDARSLRSSASLLSAAVFADSAVEHYRAEFYNPGMVTPLVIASLAMAIDVAGAGVPRRTADGVHAAALVFGSAGVAFHCYNVSRQPGGWSWLNLFYAAPVGAPAALALSGVIGLAATVIDRAPETQPTFVGIDAGRALAALTAAGLAGTVGEAGLMHFRGSFQNPFMMLPVTVPPVAAALLANAAAGPASRDYPVTRFWLRLTAGLGLAGVGFHAYGVSRAMGGWYNWSQNLIDGPPLPAPPSFTALAVAGLAALRLRERAHGSSANA